MSIASRSRALLIAVSAAFLFSALAITPSSGGSVVAFSGGYWPGTIVVRTKERKLYLVFGFGRRCNTPSASDEPDGSGPAVLT